MRRHEERQKIYQEKYEKERQIRGGGCILIPGICMLMVYMVFFTLYAHDYAVCIHAVLETGIRGSYQTVGRMYR